MEATGPHQSITLLAGRTVGLCPKVVWQDLAEETTGQVVDWWDRLGGPWRGSRNPLAAQYAWRVARSLGAIPQDDEVLLVLIVNQRFQHVRYLVHVSEVSPGNVFPRITNR